MRKLIELGVRSNIIINQTNTVEQHVRAKIITLLIDVVACKQAPTR